MSHLEIKLYMLAGTMPYKPPCYWIEPRLDLRGRVKDWCIKSDYIGLGYFKTHGAALMAALGGGMRIGPKPSNG